MPKRVTAITFLPTGARRSYVAQQPTDDAGVLVVCGDWIHRCSNGSMSRVIRGTGDDVYQTERGELAGPVACELCREVVGEVRVAGQRGLNMGSGPRCMVTRWPEAPFLPSHRSTP